VLHVERRKYCMVHDSATGLKLMLNMSTLFLLIRLFPRIFSLCGPPSLLSNAYLGSFVGEGGLKWLGNEADHSPPSIAEVKKMSIYTYTPPYVTFTIFSSISVFALVHILSQMNPIHALSLHFLQFQLNIILPSTPSSFQM
jgi:hypothetical protein